MQGKIFIPCAFQSIAFDEMFLQHNSRAAIGLCRSCESKQKTYPKQ